MKLLLAFLILILSACAHPVVMNECKRVDGDESRFVCEQRLPWRK